MDGTPFVPFGCRVVIRPPSTADSVSVQSSVRLSASVWDGRNSALSLVKGWGQARYRAHCAAITVYGGNFSAKRLCAHTNPPTMNVGIAG